MFILRHSKAARTSKRLFVELCAPESGHLSPYALVMMCVTLTQQYGNVQECSVYVSFSIV